jgi:glycosyltransferase involved in cell wall biosynthesis
MNRTLRILHYGLGYPPARSGGQVWYILDLVRQQVAAGHEVAYLYPGRLDPFVRRAYVKTLDQDVSAKPRRFELVNSLPLPLFRGIRQPDDFCKPSDIRIFLALFESLRPDVIHVHTLMGLYREFMMAASQRNIPVVFTSHDYFGLSPVPDFYFAGKSWHQDNSAAFWCHVGAYAMSTRVLRVFQIGIYPRLRDFLKRIRGSGHAERHSVSLANCDWSAAYANDMEALRNYYRDIFSGVTRFHFNSTVAHAVYCENLGFEPVYFDIVSVTNASVTKAPLENRLPRTPLRVAYIGPYLEYKGFFDFLDVARDNKNPDLEFHLWGDDRKIDSPCVVNHGRFRRDKIDDVYSNIDLLIFPSRWQETFGLIAVEALDHGVPLLVSRNAGIKDLLPNEWIFNTREELQHLIATAPVHVPHTIRNNLRTMAEHATDMEEVYFRSLFHSSSSKEGYDRQL